MGVAALAVLPHSCGQRVTSNNNRPGGALLRCQGGRAGAAGLMNKGTDVWTEELSKQPTQAQASPHTRLHCLPPSLRPAHRSPPGGTPN